MIIASGTIIQRKSRITDGARRTRAAVCVSCVAIASMPFAFQTGPDEITNDQTFGRVSPLRVSCDASQSEQSRHRSAAVNVIVFFQDDSPPRERGGDGRAWEERSALNQTATLTWDSRPSSSWLPCSLARRQ